MYIAIAGNIGSGKSSLTSMLAEHFGWEPAFESVDDNPYLEDFYQDMERWTFHLEVYFLNHRFRQVQRHAQQAHVVIQDRTIFEGADIFVENLHRSGLMNERDYSNYRSLADLMLEHVPTPELLIYLRTDVDRLLQQIEKRGRDYEKRIPRSYLENLNELYEAWIGRYKGPLLVVDMQDVDFVQHPEHFAQIAQQVSQSLRQPSCI